MYYWARISFYIIRSQSKGPCLIYPLGKILGFIQISLTFLNTVHCSFLFYLSLQFFCLFVCLFILLLFFLTWSLSAFFNWDLRTLYLGIQILKYSYFSLVWEILPYFLQNMGYQFLIFFHFFISKLLIKIIKIIFNNVVKFCQNTIMTFGNSSTLQN